MRTGRKDDGVHVEGQGHQMTETVLNLQILDGGAATYSPFVESRIETSLRPTLRLNMSPVLDSSGTNDPH